MFCAGAGLVLYDAGQSAGENARFLSYRCVPDIKHEVIAAGLAASVPRIQSLFWQNMVLRVQEFARRTLVDGRDDAYAATVDLLSLFDVGHGGGWASLDEQEDFATQFAALYREYARTQEAMVDDFQRTRPAVVVAFEREYRRLCKR